MYDSIKMGEYLASYAVRKGHFINQTKLQKLLYILYGGYLANYNRSLLNEHPKAWPYGPVFPRVQKKFAKVGRNLAYADIDDAEYSEIKADTELNALLNDVLKTFGSWTAQALSEWSHQEGSPWASAFFANGMEYNAEITDEAIKDYFNSIMH